MDIDEQIEILQAYKAGETIDYNASRSKGRININTYPHWRFNFQQVEYSIAPSFIIVNGVEVPEPCRVMPCLGENYYFPHFGDDSGVMGESFRNDDYDKRVFEAGCMHLTEAAARTHYEALILPSKQK